MGDELVIAELPDYVCLLPFSRQRQFETKTSRQNRTTLGDSRRASAFEKGERPFCRSESDRIQIPHGWNWQTNHGRGEYGCGSSSGLRVRSHHCTPSGTLYFSKYWNFSDIAAATRSSQREFAYRVYARTFNKLRSVTPRIIRRMYFLLCSSFLFSLSLSLSLVKVSIISIWWLFGILDT